MSETKLQLGVTEPYKPSQVVLRVVTPLIGTFGKAQAEFAACLMVRACVRHGDVWQDLSPQQIGAAITADIDEKTDPLYSLRCNPFFNPDIWELVERGFAEWVDEPGKSVRFTSNGFDAMRKWTKP
jgi:hypothetical protein